MLRSWFQSAASDTSPSWLPPIDACSTAQSRSSLQLSTRSYQSIPSTPSASKKQATRRRDDPFTPFERSEAAIRRRLQGLLDAQAEGLLASVGGRGSGQTENHSKGSHRASKTSTSQVVPVRQPQTKPLSLSAARHGIRDALVELSTVKEGELQACAVEIEGTQDRLQVAKDLDDREGGLKEEIAFIEENENKDARDSLEAEDHALQEQIDILEAQLSRLRDQQAAVRRQLADVTDNVQSKLSSYRQSQRLLECEARAFLRSEWPITNGSGVSYMSLPTERRTLSMAIDCEAERRDDLEARRKTLLEQKQALGAGAITWSETMAAVARFEASLRKGIESLAPEGKTEDGPHDHSIEQLLEDMDIVIEELEGKLELSETNGWKLLVCCIAAELEAFRQGRDMLRSLAGKPATGETRLNGHEEVESVASAESTYSPAAERSNAFEGPLHGSASTIRRFQDQRQKQSRSSKTAHDEEPDSDLLMTARSDTSTENDETDS